MSGIDISTIKYQTRISTPEIVKHNSLLKRFLNLNIKFGKRLLPNKKRLNFYTDLHALLISGIDIKTAFDLIVDNYNKKDDRQLFTTIQKSIIHGAGLSEALEQTCRFSIYEYYSIKIGEETGRLQEVLRDLIQYFTKKIEQQRKLTNAFSYPVIVLLTAMVAIYFMMNFIVPMFQDVFQRYGKELPALTKLVIRISRGFSTYFFIFLVMTILFILLVRFIRNKQWYRRIISNLLLHIPVFGKLIRKVHLSRFCLAMELLMSSHTPLLQAVHLIKKMISFYPISHSLDNIQEDILHGKSLHESMSNFKIYDRRMISLIKVAEEVNQLDKVFERLKDQYNSEIEYQTGIISTIMEPLMIIFIGIFVGIILISMYLPMFQLSSGFGS